MFRKFSVLSLLVVLALGLGGWSAPSVAGQGQGGGPPETMDDLFARVAQHTSGFGGMYVEGDVLKVHLTDARQGGAAERAIAAVFGDAGIPAGGIQVVPGRYNYKELKTWQEAADSLLDIDGVVFTDADEVANQVKIGIEREELRGRVQAELRRLDVPADATEIVVTEPVVQIVLCLPPARSK